MSRRRLWITSEHPLLGTCEYCTMQFSGGESPLAKSDIQQQFYAHKCTSGEVSKAGAPRTREETEAS